MSTQESIDSAGKALDHWVKERTRIGKLIHQIAKIRAELLVARFEERLIQRGGKATELV
jgi:hypothetical protein